jgi:flagellar basal-body rod protein FlgF
MSDGITISAISMSNDMQRLNHISQNLTNALTPGYKRSIPFDTILSAVRTNGDQNFTALIHETVSTLDMRQGTLRATGNSLDLGIENAGFFEIQHDGQTFYTRQGNFALDSSGRLVTQGGDLVMGVDGELRLASNQPTIDRQGRILENGKSVGQIKLVEFFDPNQLQNLGEGKYIQGNADVKPNGKIAMRQGHLEGSNVNTASEMVRMIETMRHFETGQKIIQMYDEMNGRAITKLGEF